MRRRIERRAPQCNAFQHRGPRKGRRGMFLRARTAPANFRSPLDPKSATNDTNETLAKDRTRTPAALRLTQLAKFVERLQSRLRDAIGRRRFDARIGRLRGGIDLAQARYLRALIGECGF